MGNRGPKPQPAMLKLLRGNPGRRAIDLSDGVHPEVAIPAMPRWLCAEARVEWKRIVPELQLLGLLTRLDRAALAIYCQSFGRLVQVEYAIGAHQAELAAKGELVAHALVQTTPTGFAREDVLSKMAADLRIQVDRFLTAFGLSPSSRSRVTASRNAGQLALPGVEQPGWAGFPDEVVMVAMRADAAR